MTFHNNAFIQQQEDTEPRVPFKTLKIGDKYKHSVSGNISTVFKIDEDVVIKRADGWLVTVKKDSDNWFKMVIKI